MSEEATADNPIYQAFMNAPNAPQQLNDYFQQAVQKHAKTAAQPTTQSSAQPAKTSEQITMTPQISHLIQKNLQLVKEFFNDNAMDGKITGSQKQTMLKDLASQLDINFQADQLKRYEDISSDVYGRLSLDCDQFISSVLDWEQDAQVQVAIKEVINNFVNLSKRAPKNEQNRILTILDSCNNGLSQIVTKIPTISKIDVAKQNQGLQNLFDHYSKRRQMPATNNEWTMQIFMQFCNENGLVGKVSEPYGGRKLSIKEWSIIFKKSCPVTMTFDKFLQACQFLADLYYNEEYDRGVSLRTPEEKLTQFKAMLMLQRKKYERSKKVTQKPAQQKSVRKLSHSVDDQIQKWHEKQQQNQEERNKQIMPKIQQFNKPSHLNRVKPKIDARQASQPKKQERKTQDVARAKVFSWKSLSVMDSRELRMNIETNSEEDERDILGAKLSEVPSPTSISPGPPGRFKKQRPIPIKLKGTNYVGAIEKSLDDRYNAIFEYHQRRIQKFSTRPR